jgi:hypothetical protein
MVAISPSAKPRFTLLLSGMSGDFTRSLSVIDALLPSASWKS